MTNRLNTPPRPANLTEAVHQTVGWASVCWEDMSGTGVFDSVEARLAAESLLEYIRLQADPDALALVFKAAWHRADRQGRKGHRTDAGIAAVIAEIFGEHPEDPNQAPLFDCD